MISRLLGLLVGDGDQLQHAVSKISGIELPRLQLEAVYIIYFLLYLLLKYVTECIQSVRSAVLLEYPLLLLALQDFMIRESRRTRGDPVVLAAQSREQYYKVTCLYNVMLVYTIMHASCQL